MRFPIGPYPNDIGKNCIGNDFLATAFQPTGDASGDMIWRRIWE